MSRPEIVEPAGNRAAAVERDTTGAWASLMLRLAIASLFVAAVVPKWMQGLAAPRNVAGYFAKAFEQGWLHLGLVRLMGYANPFVEALIVIWLLIGIRIKAAWVFTTAYLITLAFGMASIGKHDIAGFNYLYVLIASIGLYLSRFDRFNLDSWPRRSP